MAPGVSPQKTFCAIPCFFYKPCGVSESRKRWKSREKSTTTQRKRVTRRHSKQKGFCTVASSIAGTLPTIIIIKLRASFQEERGKGSRGVTTKRAFTASWRHRENILCRLRRWPLRKVGQKLFKGVLNARSALQQTTEKWEGKNSIIFVTTPVSFLFLGVKRSDYQSFSIWINWANLQIIRA